MASRRREFKVYQDEAKQRLTSHWDMDYMTSAEIEAALSEENHRSLREERRDQSQRREPLARLLRSIVAPFRRRQRA